MLCLFLWCLRAGFRSVFMLAICCRVTQLKNIYINGAPKVSFAYPARQVLWLCTTSEGNCDYIICTGTQSIFTKRRYKLPNQTQQKKGTFRVHGTLSRAHTVALSHSIWCAERRKMRLANHPTESKRLKWRRVRCVKDCRSEKCNFGL